MVFDLLLAVLTDKSAYEELIDFISLKVGIIKSCDAAMKQFLLHLDETFALGRKFIIQDLDERHLFISVDILDTLQAKVDDLMDQISFPLADKGI
ncbi:general transcription factor IIH subunit 5 isoform X1 [Osmia bicornis bicornis]|uniref:general transcription factor IIH subunit 5 isoform X1 n=1 Tax=Osmia bicornis bicornis TaxID=1437191 RepID=UPI0010F714C4|nr:general transcription factor IIH subunit 5 isoform X1 [Osmia bicornis bicornis]